MPRQETLPTLSRREAMLPEFNQTWEPIGMMTRMREAMDSMLHDLFGGLTPPVQSFDTAWTPAVNLHLEGDKLIAECALPGLQKSDVNVQATANVLKISAQYKHEDKKEKEGVFRSEIVRGKFYRHIQLPFDVKVDGIKANMDQGILMVVMPLLEPAVYKTTNVVVG